MPHAHAKIALGLTLVAVLAGCQHVQQQGEASAPPVAELQPNLRVEVSRAHRALRDGRLGAARDGFATALQSSPNDVAAGLGLAETYMALADFTTAKRVFDATARFAQGRDRARLAQGFGLIALNAEDLSTARQQLRLAVDSDDRLWRAWVGLGRIHARAGEENAARVAFAQAEAAAPSLGQVMNDIGMSYMMERQPKQAVPYFERALVADSRLEMARGNLRIARAMAGEYDLAIAGAPGGELPDALNNVGYIAVVNGDFDVADRFLRRALEISPSYHAAAAANLNLLAHVQASGVRPTVAARLASGAPVQAEASAPSPAPAPSVPKDRVAAAATQSGTIPQTTGNIGLGVDEARQGVAEATTGAQALSVTPLQPVQGATEPVAGVSDVREAAQFAWADRAEPKRAVAIAEHQQALEPDLSTSDVAKAGPFKWEGAPAANPAATPERPKKPTSKVVEVNMRDDGFLWARETFE